MFSGIEFYRIRIQKLGLPQIRDSHGSFNKNKDAVAGRDLNVAEGTSGNAVDVQAVAGCLPQAQPDLGNADVFSAAVIDLQVISAGADIGENSIQIYGISGKLQVTGTGDGIKVRST